MLFWTQWLICYVYASFMIDTLTVMCSERIKYGSFCVGGPYSCFRYFSIILSFIRDYPLISIESIFRKFFFISLWNIDIFKDMILFIIFCLGNIMIKSIMLEVSNVK